MKKKVLFIYHGGTIGMKVEQTGPHSFVNRLPIDSNEFRETTEVLLKHFSDRFDITYSHMTIKDSSNLQPSDWTRLAIAVKRAQEEGFHAVAITHGTDSMQYSAAALAMALHGSNPEASFLKIPVVMTGAQNSIYVRGGDGEFNLVNLFRTIDAALDAQVADVLISFWDIVILGCRSIKVSERQFRAFSSPAYPNVGVINALGVELHSQLLRTSNSKQGGIFAPKFVGGGVISIEVEPGFDPDAFRTLLDTGRYQAVIIKTMGDGNIPTEGQYNLTPVIHYATKELKIPIFLAVKTDGANASSSHYDAGIEAINAGAIPCYDHSGSTVAVKVRWLIANGLSSTIEDFRKAMATSYANEVTPPLH